MIRAGLARVAKLFVGVALASGAGAALIGAAAGAGLARSLSVGWYCAGALVLLLAFVTSSRGPTRSAEGEPRTPVSLRARSLRWASRDEQEEALSVSALLVVLGVALIALGVLVDPVHPVF